MEKLGLKEKILPISSMHGKVFEADVSYGKVIMIPLYHPAVAIYNIHTKDTLIKDFQVLKSYK
jgi:DNA polymerase